MNELRNTSFDYLAKAGKTLPKESLMPAIEARLKAEKKTLRQVLLIAAASVAILAMNVVVYSNLSSNRIESQKGAVAASIGNLTQSFNLYQ